MRAPNRPGPAPPGRRAAADFPWWLVVTLVLAAVAAVAMLRDPTHAAILGALAAGLWTTVWVTAVAFVLATLIGVLLARALLSRRLVLRQAARFVVEILRGVPMLVLLLYVAFVAAPGLVVAWNAVVAPLGLDPASPRDLPFAWRAVAALALGYGAFIAEVFRAGIEAVDPGQVEAAQALGLHPGQRFRLVVLPQALRTILPPLGNDLVALVKDSALVSVLGVADITQLGKVYAAGSFRYFETYNVVAFLYLVMTVGLGLGVRALERRLRRHRTGGEEGDPRGNPPLDIPAPR